MNRPDDEQAGSRAARREADAGPGGRHAGDPLPHQDERGRRGASGRQSPDADDGAIARARPSALLSALLRYHAVDVAGRRGRIVDLVLDLREADDLPVSSILVDAQGELARIHGIGRLDPVHRVIRVPDLSTAVGVDVDALAACVLARRDVLDSLVIDLRRRRTTRVNDLIIEDRDGHLALDAADIGLRALVRRATFGVVPLPPREADVLEWEYVEYLRGDPGAARAGHDAHERVAQLPPGDIARLLDSVPYLHAAELVELLPEQVAADTVEEMTPERQLQVFEELERERRRRILELMAPEMAADLLGHLLPADARDNLERLSGPARQRIVDLLRCPRDTVGGIMTNEVITVPGSLRVPEARTLLRTRLAKPDFVYFVYVVDDDEHRRLQGVVSLRELLIADESAAITEIMNRYVIALHPLDSADDAAHRLLDARLAALPVVSPEGRLLGAVTVDAAMAVAAPASWRSQAPRVFS